MPANDISVVLTIHNKEMLAYEVMKAILLKSSPAVKEVIVVLDGCTDTSFEKVDTAVANYNTRRIPIIYVETPDVYELRANNEGMKRANGEYVILCQDDCVIQEQDYDVRLLSVFKKYNDIFAVSGRAAHNIERAWSGFYPLGYSDLMGYDNKAPRDKVFIRDAVNRGPLMLEMKRTRELEYFDEALLPQNGDDHDLCLRGYRKGWLCGSTWVDYRSDEDWGTSRSGKSIVTGDVIKKNMTTIYERHHDLIDGKKHNEERPI